MLVTDQERRDLGNKMKTATPDEYLRLVKEKGERRAAKTRKYREKGTKAETFFCANVRV